LLSLGLVIAGKMPALLGEILRVPGEATFDSVRGSKPQNFARLSRAYLLAEEWLARVK